MSARHPTLPIAALDRRHPGLTPAISAGYSEAAALSHRHPGVTQRSLSPFSGRLDRKAE